MVFIHTSPKTELVGWSGSLQPLFLLPLEIFSMWCSWLTLIILGTLFLSRRLFLHLPHWLSVRGSWGNVTNAPHCIHILQRRGFPSFRDSQILFSRGSLFIFRVSKNTIRRPTCSRVTRPHTLSVSDTDVAATWLQLYVRGCYSDTMVMSLHPNDASVGCLRSWDISGQWVDWRMTALKGAEPCD